LTNLLDLNMVNLTLALVIAVTYFAALALSKVAKSPIGLATSALQVVFGALFRGENWIRAIIPQIGFRSTVVTYDRHERFAGESKYPLKKNDRTGMGRGDFVFSRPAQINHGLSKSNSTPPRWAITSVNTGSIWWACSMSRSTAIISKRSSRGSEPS
jgi:hypothetical protein